MNTRTPTSPSISGCGCWRRVRHRTFAASAMTISRFMVGAGPRWTTSCVSRRTFPAPRSFGWSATIAPRAIFWRRPPISSPTTRRGWARPCSPMTIWVTAVVVSGVWDDEEEARAIAEDIEAERTAGRRLNEIAILVRASFQMRAFEDRFVTLGLPYRVIGGPRFYERQEIKDAIAYLEVVLNPANDLKFERIVNVPKRGVGDSSLRRLAELARARAGSLYQAAREIVETEELAGKTRRSLADLIAMFERWRRQVAGMKHTELAELILDESGYTQMWQQDR